MILLAKKKSKTNWIEIDNIKLLIDYPTNNQEMLLQEILLDNLSEQIKQLRYARLYLRYTIKDWKGIEADCLIINNELEKDLWESLVSDSMQALTIFGKVYEQLTVTENDKKKS